MGYILGILATAVALTLAFNYSVMFGGILLIILLIYAIDDANS